MQSLWESINQQSNMKLFYLEQQILNQIATTFEYSFAEVNKVYQTSCSFDKTIQVLDYCRNADMDLGCINDVVELIDKKWL